MKYKILYRINLTSKHPTWSELVRYQKNTASPEPRTYTKEEAEAIVKHLLYEQERTNKFFADPRPDPDRPPSKPARPQVVSNYEFRIDAIDDSILSQRRRGEF